MPTSAARYGASSWEHRERRHDTVQKIKRVGAALLPSAIPDFGSSRCHFDDFPGNVPQEAGRRAAPGLPVEQPRGRMEQVQLLLGPRDAHVADAPLLVGAAPSALRARVREQPLVQPQDEDGPISFLVHLVNRTPRRPAGLMACPSAQPARTRTAGVHFLVRDIVMRTPARSAGQAASGEK